MPFSTPIFKDQTRDYINNYFDKKWKILDIGAGCGTYGDMLTPMGFYNIDAIEIYKPYISDYSLKNKYKTVYCENIIDSNINLQDYDAFILGDVIEHMSSSDSISLFRKINHAKEIVVCVPFNAPQGEHYGNIYETHIQENLTNQAFLNLYRNFDILCLRYDYGIYIKHKYNLKELYTIDLTENDKEFLNNYYPHRTIINLNEKE
jgi:hypothetical protein